MAAKKQIPRNSFWDHFEDLEDPRDQGRNLTHPLRNIIILAVVSIACGQRSFFGIAEFSRMQAEWFRPYLDPFETMPSRDTFRRVFEMLCPAKFERSFQSWAHSLRVPFEREVVPIDGKTVRNSGRHGERPLHIVSAWASTNRLVIGQVATAEKSNEITAIPKLLDMLDIKGSVITVDAMGCQREIAAAILEKEADYVLAVKDNQKTLHTEVAEYFEAVDKGVVTDATVQCHQESDKGHGRIETRRCTITSIVDWFEDREKWAGLNTLIRIESERIVREKPSTEQRFYISSLTDLTAKQALDITRKHWSIENEYHYCIDVSFGEDRACIRDRTLALNIASAKRVAMNLLRRLPMFKGNLAQAQRFTAFDLGVRDALMRSIT